MGGLGDRKRWVSMVSVPVHIPYVCLPPTTKHIGPATHQQKACPPSTRAQTCMSPATIRTKRWPPSTSTGEVALMLPIWSGLAGAALPSPSWP